MSNHLHVLEQIPVVDNFLFRANVSKLQSELIAPDNYAELIIPMEKSIRTKLIGNARAIDMHCGSCYFFSPRRRGLEIFNPSNYLLLKINPIYSKKISDRLDEILFGVYEVSFNQEVMDELLRLAELKDVYKISDFFIEFIEYQEHNDTILESIERIRDMKGMLAISDIYTALNISKSKLEQHFNREIGLTPKEFCRIEKINAFIASRMDDPEKSLTELTYECGYYDQSHLIKDFRYFLDTSPKKYFDSI